MKKLVFFLIAMFIMSLGLVFGQSETTSTGFHPSVGQIIAVIYGIYESLALIVPTSKVWSLVGLILKWVSQGGNIKK